jgi:hypothetical protein
VLVAGRQLAGVVELIPLDGDSAGHGSPGLVAMRRRPGESGSTRSPTLCRVTHMRARHLTATQTATCPPPSYAHPYQHAQHPGGGNLLHKHALDALQARHGLAGEEGGGHWIAFSLAITEDKRRNSREPRPLITLRNAQGSVEGQSHPRGCAAVIIYHP